MRTVSNFFMRNLQRFAQPVGQVSGTRHQSVGVEVLEVLPGVLPGTPDFGWKKLVAEPASQPAEARFGQWKWLFLRFSYKLGFRVQENRVGGQIPRYAQSLPHQRHQQVVKPVNSFHNVLSSV